MPLSLKDSVQRQQPEHTKAVIKLALCSPGGIKRTWCVVEAPDDVMVYQKFFDSAKVTSKTHYIVTYPLGQQPVILQFFINNSD